MKITRLKNSNPESADSVSQKDHPIFYAYMNSPIGRILVASQDDHLIRIHFNSGRKSDLLSQLKKEQPETVFVENKNKNQPILNQLSEYFSGTRHRFSIPYRFQGTAFQKSVWEAISRIPYGHTSSYGEIARQIGNPKASRAVGGANKSNHLPIVIPCHRIIGADGSMTGYGGKEGIPLKIKLLDLEKQNQNMMRI
ncbi:methylated-DNA--[protein]-cysteine S-methyltransferase [bacterium]|nr:methylated-DNA--[protein]-cysteine S-methyltransferase [bacterium]RQV93795.1 MAG: methylated-DNA--[protein]-cysteine S-methyltransferase [bacterium]